MRKDIIKPNETEYNGYLFRSKLEAQWAVVFDSLGIRYEYEPEGFELEDGTRYLPDFYFPDQDTYGEVKPDRPGALEELFDKSLKFVENGTIERLIILPNIPAATKKYPVWWVPIVVKNPFEPFSDKDWPFSNLLVTKAMLNKKRISMNDYPTIHQINIDPEFFAIDIKSFIDDSRHHRKPNKWVVKSLHDMFLQAIPSREMNYFLGCQILNPDMTMEDILAEKEVENAPVIMRAYKKARQARQCRRGADLRGKDLRGAMLDGAIMDKHTCLTETDLSGASMSGAYLSGTDLRHTKLNEVNVNGAVFSQIIVDDSTDFKGTDLSHTEFSIAEKVMNAFPVRAVLAITVLVGIILLTLVLLTGMPNNILCAAIFALLPVEIFAVTLSCRLFVPAMYHAIELTDVSRYMRIAAGKEIELDKLATLFSLFKDYPKGGKDCRQLVADEIGYYTGKGYFPEGCYNTENGTVCFVVRDKNIDA